MTTVAGDARLGVLVCDSRCVYGDTQVAITKVHRIGDELIGLAGDVKHGQDFLAWLRRSRRGVRPKGDEYTALILRKDGLWQWDSNGCEMRLELGYHAIGTGAHAALGAMKAGAAVEAAVRIACEIDAGSGGEVIVHHLETPCVKNTNR